MDFKDYYQTLGVSRGASEKEIRSAYRRLARQFHPDVNPGNKAAEERFKAINEANEVLSNPENRRKYDELGAHWQEAGASERARQQAGARGRPFEGFQTGFAGAPGGGSRAATPEEMEEIFGRESPFSDFFTTFFGGEGGLGRRPRPGRRARAGADLESPVEVSLAEAYDGARRVIEVEQPDGSTRRLEVTIPPGVADGTRVRVAGQGSPGVGGGPPGDLYLIVSVRPDARFEREGRDLRTSVAVPLATAILGGEVRVPKPDGRQLGLAIPPGTQDGRVFRLRGQGMPTLGRPGQRGDLLVALHVRLPEHPTARQRELLEELARTEEPSPAGAR